MRDPEAKEWQLPLQGTQVRQNSCAGKSLADSVEAMIGAHLLTNDNLLATLQWISDIKLVPLEHAYILRKFENLKQSTYPNLKRFDLQKMPFSKEDSLRDLFAKYFAIVEPSPVHSCLLGLVEAEEIGSFGHYINAISHFHGQMFISQALRRLERL
jgi:hypothetical protein